MPEQKKEPEQILKEQDLLDRKRLIRNRMRAERKAMAPQWILRASERIQKAVMACPEYQAAQSIGCYQSLPYEVQTGALIRHCRETGRKICFPAYREEQQRYELVWLDEQDPLRSGRLNIPEPAGFKKAGLADIDCIIVPALAFSPDGKRLGHGGGHYDRILGAWTAFKIGVAFDFQIHEDVPMGSMDIPVDLVITEQHLFRDGIAQDLKTTK